MNIFLAGPLDHSLSRSKWTVDSCKPDRVSHLREYANWTGTVYKHFFQAELLLDSIMNKRGRQQSPLTIRKRQKPSQPMRTVTSPTPSLSEDTGLEPIRSPSVESLSSSITSRSTSVSMEARRRSNSFSQGASPRSSESMASSHFDIVDPRPVFAKRFSSYFQVPLIVSSDDSIEHIDQAAASMAIVGPLSPVSITESTPNLTPKQTQHEDTLSLRLCGDTFISTQLTIPQKQ